MNNANLFGDLYSCICELKWERSHENNIFALEYIQREYEHTYKQIIANPLSLGEEIKLKMYEEERRHLMA